MPEAGCEFPSGEIKMIQLKIWIFCAIAMILFASWVFALQQNIKFQVSPVFSNHMVLQRDTPLEIFGQAAPGKSVAVEIAGQRNSGLANAKGEWAVKLKPMAAGGPYEMTITAGEIIRLNDVLIGDVWFCSGQSNMEWPLVNTNDGAEELKNFGAKPNIRLFLQQQTISPKPLQNAAGDWTLCDAENAKNFSAVAYHMGKHLQKEINVPIGLIESAWGGTPAEIWMDENLLKGNPVTQPILDRWKGSSVYDWKAWNNGKGMDFNVEISDIRFVSSSGRAGPAYVKASPDAEGVFGGTWSSWAKPGSSAAFRVSGNSGRLSGMIGFNAWAGAGTLLKDGTDVDLSAFDAIKFKVRGNGRFSVSLTQNSISDYDYYSSQDYDAAGTWQDISIPMASLKQGGWGLAKPFTQNAIVQIQFNIKSLTMELPSALFNGMVAPFTRYKIRGAAWYQGENNIGRAAQYRTLLPLLIRNWRTAWAEGDFPFLVIQLPNFGERRTEPGESAWAELREAQLKALDLPNTAVVSIIDLGDAKDVHPRNKEPVGVRLAKAALVVSYGKEGPSTGPIYNSISIQNGEAIIKFKNTGSGLISKDGELKGFAIAGDDGQFKWARAEIRDDTVVVWNFDIREPKAVRYGWADNPECNLYNKEGLAASPFRTDDWPGITDNNR